MINPRMTARIRKDRGVDPHKSFASAIIRYAVKDMHCKGSTRTTDHVDAVCWLASNRGTRWFDLVDIDQEYSLPKLRWSVYAKDILSDDEILLSDDQRQMLTLTLKHLQPLHNRDDDA